MNIGDRVRYNGSNATFRYMRGTIVAISEDVYRRRWVSPFRGQVDETPAVVFAVKLDGGNHTIEGRWAGEWLALDPIECLAELDR